MIFVLQRKKDKMFYSGNKWVEIEKAKLFKRKGDLFLYLNHRPRGLFSYEDGKTTKMDNVNIVGVNLIVTGVQKKVYDEYKTKQLLNEIERNE